VSSQAPHLHSLLFVSLVGKKDEGSTVLLMVLCTLFFSTQPIM
jgi:hypothetical protein